MKRFESVRTSRASLASPARFAAALRVRGVLTAAAAALTIGLAGVLPPRRRTLPRRSTSVTATGPVLSLSDRIDKGWFKEAGVDVNFQWFDYSASLDAFSADKLDAVGATNGDAFVTGASGAKNVMILLTDYSSGNDMIVAKPPVRTVEGLKGKKVGVEMGLVDHLLLDTALEKHALKESDITLVNAKTNELPQVLASSNDVAAVGAWQPTAGEALKRVPGSRVIFTSADAPGLIYDAITVNPASLSIAQSRLGQSDQGLVSLRGLYQRSEDAAGRGQNHVRAGRSTPAQYLPLAERDAVC